MHVHQYDQLVHGYALGRYSKRDVVNDPSAFTCEGEVRACACGTSTKFFPFNRQLLAVEAEAIEC
jgi:hypothetical protein